jgi:hypothetical protein
MVKWDWRGPEENIAHRPDHDPERKAAIKLTIVTLGFIAALGLMCWVLFG